MSVMPPPTAFGPAGPPSSSVFPGVFPGQAGPPPFGPGRGPCGSMGPCPMPPGPGMPPFGSMPSGTMPFPQPLGSMGGYPGSLPGDSMRNVPLMPGNVQRLPQPVLDSSPEDGAVSIAVDVKPKLLSVSGRRPAPATNQYLNRWWSEVLEQRRLQPRHMTDICGWVQAAVDPDDLERASYAESSRMNLFINEDRQVYASTNGWAFQMWRSQDDFEHGVHGPQRGGSRPLMWWDLRRAFDVMVDISDVEMDNCPHRIAVLSKGGNIFFRVEFAEDVPLWYFAIRRIIQDAYVAQVDSHDTRHKQLKRWPAAIGTIRALIHGDVIGSRAMAVLFHAYDIDYDCGLEVGEIMLLIKELYAAQLHLSGRAEADTRDSAIFSADSRMDKETQFEKAVEFRRWCDRDGNGRVEKDEFIRYAQVCLNRVLDDAPPSPNLYDEWGEIKMPGHSKDACTVM